jgi:hypothetical protein
MEHVEKKPFFERELKSVVGGRVMRESRGEEGRGIVDGMGRRQTVVALIYAAWPLLRDGKTVIPYGMLRRAVRRHVVRT